MLRKFLPLVIAFSAVGCAAQTDSPNEGLTTTDQALEVECDPALPSCPDEDTAPAARVVTLTAWDAATGTLSYAGGSIAVASTTRVRRAPLANFVPEDPILPLARTWNALIKAPGPNVFGSTAAPPEGVQTFSTLTSQLASLGAHMKLKLRSDGTVKAIRLVP
jgi:hypothetical protein